MAICSCGAKTSNHPAAGYSVQGACLEALKMQRVMVLCGWPGCHKRARKQGLGETFCREHDRREWAAFMGIMKLEGPSTLNRPLPTLAERVEFDRTGELPQSRRVKVTAANTRMHCGICDGPLVIYNDPDWSPDIPNAMAARYDSTGSAGSAVPWGIGICQCCSFSGCEHCLYQGEMVSGHQPDLFGRCQRCGRRGSVEETAA